MDEQQYWDCDICEERYPYNGGSQKHGDHSPIKRETADGEVLWLCGGCAVTSSLNLGVGNTHLTASERT